MTRNNKQEQPKNRKSWDIKNLSEAKGEILIYGDIETYQWLEEDVTAFTFAKELRDMGDVKEIDVRINSNGGSVFAAQAIYSLLKHHPAFINIYIDGLAASAASIIAMAGDRVYMRLNGIFMVHNPWTSASGEKKDLEKTIEMLEKVKETIINTYIAKTGLTYEQLSELMDQEEWLTAEEAVALGFCDELIEPFDAIASLNGNTLVMNGVNHDISSSITKPDLNQQENPVPTITNKPKVITTDLEGEEELKTLEEFKNKYPDLYNQAVEEGIENENKRIKEIEDLGVLQGNEDLVNKAKFETKASASNLAMDILKAQQNQGANFLENRQKDAEQINNLDGSTPPEGNLSEAEEREQKSDALAAILNKKREGVR